MVISDLLTNTDRRFILVGGKGGVGKSSISASLATTFANNGQPTLIISTDPAHSLSDSFNQDLTGGKPTAIEGVEGLFGMEIDPQDSTNDFKMLAGIEKDDHETVNDIVSGLSQFGFSEFGDLMNTIPPGFDEALALAKVIQFVNDDEYAHYQRIVFDTAPTGHTLRLLSLPDFMDSFVGKLIKIRIKMNNTAAMFKSLLGVSTEKDRTLELMEALKQSMGLVQDLFRDKVQTEFIIATIPTIMAINESERLKTQLTLEDIQVKHIIVNQIMPENLDCKFCSVRAQGQAENLEYISKVFHDLSITEVEFFDHEVRGVKALTEMGQALIG